MISIQAYRAVIGRSPALLSAIIKNKLNRKTLVREYSHKCELFEYIGQFRLWFMLVSLLFTVILYKYGMRNVVRNSLSCENQRQVNEDYLETDASNVGAVHFIRLLLCMHGIETNPGPNPYMELDSSDIVTAQLLTEIGRHIPTKPRHHIYLMVIFKINFTAKN